MFFRALRVSEISIGFPLSVIRFPNISVVKLLLEKRKEGCEKNTLVFFHNPLFICGKGDLTSLNS